MIHHVSIGARDPKRVATVLAELMHGYAGPFIGPIPGSWVAYAEDEHGSGIEVYPDNTTLMPGAGDKAGLIEQSGTPPAYGPFHALLSVKADRAAIERIGAREGWHTVHQWRGPNPNVRLFELYEFWIENRIMFELATPDMLPAYVRLANGAAQRDLLARMPRT